MMIPTHQTPFLASWRMDLDFNGIAQELFQLQLSITVLTVTPWLDNLRLVYTRIITFSTMGHQSYQFPHSDLG